MTPLISIITINFNNAEGLEKTIQSIVEQSFCNFEYIVIDGGSTDESVNVIKKHTDKISYWISEPDKGIYNAINKGIAKSQGEYLVFMNSGDIYLNHDILKNVTPIIQKEKADIFYGQIIVNETGNDRTVIYPHKLDLTYQRSMVINHQACFFKAETLKLLGNYNENYKLAADYAYYLQATIHNKKFVAIPFPIVRYDVSGISSQKMDEYRNEMKKVWNDIIPENITAKIDTAIAKQNSIIAKTKNKLQRIITKIRNGAH